MTFVNGRILMRWSTNFIREKVLDLLFSSTSVYILLILAVVSLQTLTSAPPRERSVIVEARTVLICPAATSACASLALKSSINENAKVRLD